MAEAVVAQKGPYTVKLRAEYRYAWCACGLSNRQPWCDGSHTATGGKFGPLAFVAARDCSVLLCGCKQTGNQPYCDETHSTL